MTELVLGVGREPSRPRRLPDWTPLVLVGLAVAVFEPGCVWLAVHAEPSPLVHDLALFGHLASLVVGFGSVLVIDWMAALWLTGRRDLADLVRAGRDVAVPIWVGYAGLVLSGVLLEPDVGNPVTIAKLALVLVIGLNGAVALGVHRMLERGESARVMVLAGMSGTVSQAAWWGAVVIGHLNAH